MQLQWLNGLIMIDDDLITVLFGFIGDLLFFKAECGHALLQVSFNDLIATFSFLVKSIGLGFGLW